MKTNLPEELQEARILVDKSEKAINLRSAMEFIDEAIDIMNDYLEDNPEFPHKSFIRNQRVSSAQILLKKLRYIDELLFEDWVYCKEVLEKLKSEIEEIVQDDPSLNDGLNDFLDRYPENYLEELKSKDAINNFRCQKNISISWDVNALQSLKTWLRVQMKKLPLGEPAHIGELAISSRREGDIYVKQDGNSEALRYLLWEIHSNGSIVIIDNQHFAVIKR